MLKRVAIWVFVLALAAVGGIAAASFLRDGGGPEPPRRQANQVGQDASATSKGIELKVIGATFSGTETLLEMRAAIVDEAQVGQAAGQAEVRLVLPARDGFSGPFAGTILSVGTRADGGLLVHLPPLVPLSARPDYDGAVPLTIRAVNLRTAAGDVRLEGNWDLVLSGPTPDKLAEALRLEDLKPTTFAVQGLEVAASGQRSTSETRVEVTMPTGLTALTQSYLIVDGQRLAPYSWGETPNGVLTSFPPTKFGTPVTFDLGPVGVTDPADSVSVTIAIGEALRRAEGGPEGKGKFAIGPSDVLAGDPDIVISGERGSGWDGGEWVSVTIKGTWDHNDMPKVFDGQGGELRLLAYGTGYTKDLAGNIGPGETEVRVLLTDPSKIERLTIVMGGQAAVDRQEHTVTLRP